jgi:hypothetical protein
LGCLFALGWCGERRRFIPAIRACRARDASRIVCIRLGADRVHLSPRCPYARAARILYSIQRFCVVDCRVCLILYVNRDTALLHPAACMHFPLWGSLPLLTYTSFAVSARGCGCIGAGFTLYDSARCTRLIDLSSRCGRPEICIGFVSVTLAALASCFMDADFAARHMSRDSLFTQMKFRVSKRR